MPKRSNLFDSCDPFARAANIVDALPSALPDDTPLRELLPGIWPTLGDLRKLRDAMVKEGWTNRYEQRSQPASEVTGQPNGPPGKIFVQSQK